MRQQTLNSYWTNTLILNAWRRSEKILLTKSYYLWCFEVSLRVSNSWEVFHFITKSDDIYPQIQSGSLSQGFRDNPLSKWNAKSATFSAVVVSNYPLFGVLSCNFIKLRKKCTDSHRYLSPCHKQNNDLVVRKLFGLPQGHSDWKGLSDGHAKARRAWTLKRTSKYNNISCWRVEVLGMQLSAYEKRTLMKTRAKQLRLKP